MDHEGRRRLQACSYEVEVERPEGPAGHEDLLVRESHIEADRVVALEWALAQDRATMGEEGNVPTSNAGVDGGAHADAGLQVAHTRVAFHLVRTDGGEVAVATVVVAVAREAGEEDAGLLPKLAVGSSRQAWQAWGRPREGMPTMVAARVAALPAWEQRHVILQAIQSAAAATDPYHGPEVQAASLFRDWEAVVPSTSSSHDVKHKSGEARPHGVPVLRSQHTWAEGDRPLVAAGKSARSGASQASQMQAGAVDIGVGSSPALQPRLRREATQCWTSEHSSVEVGETHCN